MNALLCTDCGNRLEPGRITRCDRCHRAWLDTEQFRLQDELTEAREKFAIAIAESNARTRGKWFPYDPELSDLRYEYNAAIDALNAFLLERNGIAEEARDMPFIGGSGPIAGWTVGD